MSLIQKFIEDATGRAYEAGRSGRPDAQDSS
jgi:hypothetical protein